MFGGSIYLSNELDYTLDYVDVMSKYGVKTIFTSLHIAEDNKEYFKEKLKKVSNKISENNQELMVDISSKTLEIYNLKFNDLKEFLKYHHINALRIDYGFSFDQIKELSKDFKIVLNASTIDEKHTQDLINAGVNISEITVCHNFYPRIDTGLSKETFREKNDFLKEKGFKIQAFIPGDGKKRGPFHEGLPTIEDHRDINPFAAYVELKEDFKVDEILVGDTSLKEETLKRIDVFNKDRIIELRVGEIIEIPKEAKEVFWDIHKNRKDYSSRVLRSTITRIKIESPIKPNNNLDRPVGTITIDNESYGRYNGELQVAMVDLKACDRVNVIGYIKNEDTYLLPFIKDEIRFKFVEE